eukprot:PRCOL_00004109-RA
MGGKKKRAGAGMGAGASGTFGTADLRAALPPADAAGVPSAAPAAAFALPPALAALADAELVADAGGGAGGAATLTAAPTLWLSPGLMMSAGIAVGESVAVAVADAPAGAHLHTARGGEALPQGVALHQQKRERLASSPRTPPPARSPSGGKGRGAAMPLGVDVSLAPRSLAALCGVQEAEEGGEAACEQRAGNALLVAKAWPAAALPPRHCAASAQLHGSLGGGGGEAAALRLRVLRLRPAVRVAACARLMLRRAAGGAAAGRAPPPGERIERALAAFAARYMHARVLLPGNVVTLPVLGAHVAFVVHTAEAVAEVDATHAPQDGEDGAVLAYKVVDGTVVEVSLDGTAAATAAGDVGGDGGAAPAPQAPGAGSGGDDGGSGDGDAASAVARRARARGADGGGAHTSFEALSDASARALREACVLPLARPGLLARYGVRPPAGVLLHGPPGVGKTALARAAAREAGASLLWASAPELIGSAPGESEAAVRALFAAARDAAPALLFLDELDAAAPARGEGGAFGGADAESSMESRVLQTLLAEMDALGAGGGGEAALPPVVVLAATNRPAALDAALRRPGRFDVEVEVPPPTPAGRLAILHARLRAVERAGALDVAEAELARLAAGTHGFVAADLAALVDEASLEALREHVERQREGCHPGEQGKQQQDQPRLLARHLAAARQRISPSALREVAVEVPDVRWSDVGGLESVKQRLREAVEWPQAHAQALARVGARAPRGTLLFGPPGCSKTMLAKAVATECGLSFISVKGPELLSKYVGESEKAVRSLFARARAAAPAVVFFDEIDSLAAARAADGAGDSTGVGERVLSQLLTEMDGASPLAGVTVLAATNRPDMVDAALLRPGRFDRLLRVRAPDAAGREAVLRACRVPLAGDVDVAAVAARTHGFTGADLAALLQEAALRAAEEGEGGAEAVTSAHVEEALVRARPTPIDPALDAIYARFERG